MNALSKGATEQRRAYQREYAKKYRKENPDKVQEINARYWENKFKKWRAEHGLDDMSGNSVNKTASDIEETNNETT